MTIKQRLFISNILMLVIPILLSLLIASGMVFVVMEMTSNRDVRFFNENEELYSNAIKKTNSLVEKWSHGVELQQMKADVKDFNDRQKNPDISLFIYHGNELVYPSIPTASYPVLDLALSQEGSHMLVMDNIAVYREDAGIYSMILTDANFNRYTSEGNRNYRSYLINLGIMIFLVVIAIIFLTNRFLTRVVFKSIMTPLDTLAYGVHQIRDGNLNYRIEYAGKDEFDDICSDFNEMAQRLLASVRARQKDEANRKELIAGISHDLRTPLTSIKAYVEGLEKGVASTPESQKRYLDTIKIKTHDLEHIVKQLFLFSKLDIGEFPFSFERVDIGEELSNLIAAVSEEYERKGLEIALLQNVQNIYVQADVVQLRNAITNVLENSVKYKNKELGQMKITCQADGEYLTLNLADNGPGVPEEALEKLLDIFYRSDPSRSNPSKGSGLGLAITAKIIERLGGSIRAENVPEGGLAIIMMLPIYTGGDTDEKDSDYRR